MEPVFKPLEFCNGKYAVSEYGVVASLFIQRSDRRINRYRIVKPRKNHKGYLMVNISYQINGVRKLKGMKVHRLVCIAFHPNPENKPEVNHKDFDRTNNHFTNLEWATSIENINHSNQNGRRRGWKLKKKLSVSM